MPLRFDQRLYKEAAVREAASAFADVAEVTVGPVQGGAFEVTLRSRDAGTSDAVLADEFANYVLGVMRP